MGTFHYTLLYGLINFAILAVALYFVGKKIIPKMFGGRRTGIVDQIKAADDAEEKAKELLAECGYADGLDLGTFIVADQYKLLAQMVQDNLKAVGLTCELEVLEFNAYLSKLMQGDFGMTCLNMRKTLRR